MASGCLEQRKEQSNRVTFFNPFASGHARYANCDLSDFPLSQNMAQSRFMEWTAHESRLMCGRCKNTWPHCHSSNEVSQAPSNKLSSAEASKDPDGRLLRPKCHSTRESQSEQAGCGYNNDIKYSIWLNSSIWSMDMTLTDTIPPGQSGAERNGNEGTLPIPQNSRT